MEKRGRPLRQCDLAGGGKNERSYAASIATISALEPAGGVKKKKKGRNFLWDQAKKPPGFMTNLDRGIDFDESSSNRDRGGGKQRRSFT